MRLRLVPTLLAVALAACDLPTALPRWDTAWDLVPVRDTVATADLLPASVHVAPGGFTVDSFAVESRVRLADVCELCTCFDGPVPPLDIAPHDWPVALPPGLVEATLTAGTARLVLHNELGFDLLDDGQGNLGYLQVQLVDRRSGDTLQTERVARSFPAGDSLTLGFDLAGRRLHGGLVARVSGRTPGSGCRSVSLEPDAGFRARVALVGVAAATVDVILTDAAVSPPDRAFDVPRAVADRLRAEDARAVVDVELTSTLPASVEASLSLAASPDALFTAGSALDTPLPVAPGAPDAPVRSGGRYVLDLAALQGATRLWMAAHDRVTGSRRVTLSGGESLAYRVRLLAEVPLQ